MSKEKYRVEFIDVAKGISIILVALTHSYLARDYIPEFNSALGLFRMPLFFFLSGIFLNVLYSPGAFILNKSDALLKPYFATLLFVTMMLFFLEDVSLINELLGIIYGNGHTIRWAPLWFLTHLWLLYVLSYIVFRYTKLNEQSGIVKLVIILFLLSTGPFLMKAFWMLPVTISGKEYILPGLPFSADLVFLSIPYFISGFFLKNYIKKFSPIIFITSCSILVFALIAMGTEAAVRFHGRLYDEAVFTPLAAISGIYIMLCVSFYICKNKYMKNIFSRIGGASLFILIFHATINYKAYGFFRDFISVNSLLLCAVLSFIASITIPLLIRMIIQRSDFLMIFYFPLKTNKLFYWMYAKLK